jgi:hypothetical protein
MERARRSGSADAPRTTAARTPGRGLPAGMRQLQGAIGNAAMGRLVTSGRGKRTLARFGEYEHKSIGDKALPGQTWRLRKAGVPFDTPFKDFQLTFGDWIALGDWFEDVSEIREMLRPGGKGEDRIGQLYYALFAKIRPKTQAEADRAEKLGGKEDGLWTEEDAHAVNMRYQSLKTRNIKHFPNPEIGDVDLSTAQKIKRTRGGKPFGALAQYHHDHLQALNIAISAAHIPDASFLGEALAHDGFACHFLTDAFSGSHARTPRASIEAYWDKKVPKFDERLVNWLADEVTYVVINHPNTELRKKGVPEGIKEPFAGLAPGAARKAAREKIRPEVPELSFGDIVGLVVHDWEGSHGGHGPLVDVAGQRFRLVGDDALLPAVQSMRNVSSDEALDATLKSRKSTDAEKTFAGASLAVRASVNDLYAAFELAKKDTNRDRIIAKLTDKQGLFASERLLPSVVPDAKQPEADRMPKWDYGTVDELLDDPKIKAALPMSADRVGGPFKQTLQTLDASKAVKDHLYKVVVDPLTSKSVPRIIAWLHGVIGYSEATLWKRLAPPRRDVKTSLEDLRESVGAR